MAKKYETLRSKRGVYPGLSGSTTKKKRLFYVRLLLVNTHILHTCTGSASFYPYNTRMLDWHLKIVDGQRVVVRISCHKFKYLIDGLCLSCVEIKVANM